MNSTVRHYQHQNLIKNLAVNENEENFDQRLQFDFFKKMQICKPLKVLK